MRGSSKYESGTRGSMASSVKLCENMLCISKRLSKDALNVSLFSPVKHTVWRRCLGLSASLPLVYDSLVVFWWSHRKHTHNLAITGGMSLWHSLPWILSITSSTLSTFSDVGTVMCHIYGEIEVVMDAFCALSLYYLLVWLTYGAFLTHLHEVGQLVVILVNTLCGDHFQCSSCHT